MAHSGRRNADEVLLSALACGATIATAADKAGISERTAYRRLQEPAFQQRLREVRAEIVQRTAGALTAASLAAVHTLIDLQSQETPSATRLGAARAIIELSTKLRESVELTERIAALEQHQQEQPHGHAS